MIEFPGESETERLAQALGSGVLRSTWETLQAADRLDTPAGQAALVLSYRLSARSRDTAAGLAQVAKQLQATLAEALRDVPVPDDPIDELRARRERRARGA